MGHLCQYWTSGALRCGAIAAAMLTAQSGFAIAAVASETNEVEASLPRSAQIGPLTVAPDMRALTAPEKIARDRLHRMGAQAGCQHEWAIAERVWREALAIEEQTFGHDHPTTAETLNLLGTVSIEQGRFTEAEALFARALQIRQSRLGEHHLRTGESYRWMGAVLGQQGHADRAESYLRTALDIQLIAMGPIHPENPARYKALAYNLASQKKYAEAASLFRRAETVERELGVAPTMTWAAR